MDKGKLNNINENLQETVGNQYVEKSKEFQKFYIVPILYIVSVYLFPVFFLFGGANSILSYFVYSPMVFGVVNIIVSIRFCRPENRRMMLNAAMLVKCALIPFFLVGGILEIVSLLLSFIPVPFMIFLGPTVALMGAIVGWIFVIFGAPYVVSYLYLSFKENMRSGTMAVFHSILQLFFTLDVIDVLVLFYKEHKWEKTCGK